MRQEGERKGQLDAGLVREFIIAAHGNLSEVRALVAAEPALVHSVMNWGGDDWESGLGAAAHTGNRDIAEFLLSKDARMDIFTAAMLGELDIVRSLVERYPLMIDAKGAHGIPLLRHAERGGEHARPVVEYLLSKREALV
ncbi:MULTISPECIES: ankyrin repeat domain-containing protein [Sporosarcina]|uniref:ankyrin repeat domain-containing protein n=1 Tax=Sporosarcina TaxID=1569 RepID=UPI00058F1CD8|nr:MULTISPECIES: ankyrin repeat domain-containing protein [Sporosarcina]WJY26248.1 ankyrin repeat domain-containing protein [Sporosarcina sp. 0.2-SM1T-5]